MTLNGHWLELGSKNSLLFEAQDDVIEIAISHGAMA
jgi:hypothetical protein